MSFIICISPSNPTPTKLYLLLHTAMCIEVYYITSNNIGLFARMFYFKSFIVLLHWNATSQAQYVTPHCPISS